MMKRFFLISFLLLLGVALWAKPRRESRVFFGTPYRGWSILTDGMPLIYNASESHAIDYYQVKVNVNYYDKLFPTLELGYASVDKTLDNEAQYEVSSPFFRLGMDYNLISPLTADGLPRVNKSYPYLGLRYAATRCSYSSTHVPSVGNTYWPTNVSSSLSNSAVYCGWIEVMMGVHINLYKGFSLGWAASIQTFFHSTASETAALWYVPGYGNPDGAGFEFRYFIGYTFR